MATRTPCEEIVSAGSGSVGDTSRQRPAGAGHTNCTVDSQPGVATTNDRQHRQSSESRPSAIAIDQVIIHIPKIMPEKESDCMPGARLRPS